MKKPPKAIRVQYGALPYRVLDDGTVQILLLTSRRTQRWIIPKGWPIKNKKPAKSAEREAYEEAGVRGKVGMKSVGHYVYEKWLCDAVAVPCEVRVFPLEVERQVATWPEQSEREIRWLSVEEAQNLVDGDDLKELIGAFRPRLF